MKNRWSPGAAVWVGTAWVNLPVLLMMVGPMFLLAFLMKRGIIPERFVWVGFVAFGLGFVIAWIWWSYAVVRWRLWAYARVEDLEMLKTRAVAAGLIWPDGHTFERTELRSAADRRQLQQLEQRMGGGRRS